MGKNAHDASMLSDRPDEVRRGRGSGSGDYRYVALPQWALFMPLSDAALRVYALLLAHVNSTDGDQVAWPQQQSLAAMLGRHRNTISRAIRELVQAGLVTVTVERYGPNRSRRRNVYTVHTNPPDSHRGPTSVAEWYAEQRPEPTTTTNRRDRKRAGHPGRTKNGASGRTIRGASGRTTRGAGTNQRKNELKNPPTPHRANADGPRPLSRPAWCGTCDARTRHRMEVGDDGRERTRRCPRCHPLVAEVAESVTNDVAESADSVAESASVAEVAEVAESVTNVAESVASVAETTEVANVAESAVSVAETTNVAESANVAEVIADLRNVLSAIQRQQRSKRAPRCRTERAETRTDARTAGS